MKISEHFSTKELECKCGCGLFNMAPSFIVFLERIRKDYGKPMVINSGCRCEAHNKKIQGAKKSAHMEGLAVDVAVGDAALKRSLVEAAIKHGATGIGVYSSWVHIDTKERPRPVIW